MDRPLNRPNRSPLYVTGVVAVFIQSLVQAAPTPMPTETLPMLPKLALGYWQVGYNPVPAYSSSGLLRVAKGVRDVGHPGDVWILDLGSWNCGDDWNGIG